MYFWGILHKAPICKKGAYSKGTYRMPLTLLLRTERTLCLLTTQWLIHSIILHLIELSGKVT